HLLIARPRQERDDGTSSLLSADELLIEIQFGQLVEIRMTDVLCVDASFLIPALLERQTAKHVIDETLHLLDAPAGPSPKLRRHKVKHRNAVKMSPPGQPPIKAGVIDQNDRIGTLMAKVAVGASDEIDESRCVCQDASEPHNRQIA